MTGSGEQAVPSSEFRVAEPAARDLRAYVDRVPQRPGLTRHASGNTVEVERARRALDLAKAGRTSPSSPAVIGHLAGSAPNEVP